MDTKKEKEIEFVSEIPERLKTLTLSLIKTFYGVEHYVITNYIQDNVCIKEERLRDLLKLDTRGLRLIIQSLKVDKFIKERVVTEEGEGLRARKVNYYFVNYKGIINVTKYKLDHMRQKLEGREKDDVQRASYRCNTENCKKHFDSMDIGKIYDPDTHEMKCWQCNGLVTADETAGPTEETRNSLAKFNEQTNAIFSMLKEMDNIQFSREILEPPLPVSGLTKEAEPEKKVHRVGERAFNMTGKTRSELYGGGITISIGDEKEVLPEVKEAVPWLQEVQQDNTLDEEVVFNANILKKKVEEQDSSKIDRNKEITNLLMEVESDLFN